MSAGGVELPLQARDDGISVDIVSRAARVLQRTQAPGDELRLIAPAQHGRPNRRLDELGDRFALAQERLDLGAQFRLYPHRWDGGGLHESSVAQLRCIGRATDGFECRKRDQRVVETGIRRE